MSSRQTTYDRVLIYIRIDDFRFHPAILDGAVHIGVHPMLTCYKGGPRYYLPSVFGAVMVHEELLKKPFPKTIFSHYVLVKWTLGKRLLAIEPIVSFDPQCRYHRV